jgi:hypothetical protein
MRISGIFRSILIAAIAVGLSAAPVMASGDYFMLHNHTGRSMKALYVAPTSSDSWGSDILNADAPDGSDVKVTWSRNADDTCYWDVRGEFEDNTYAEVKNVDFCTVDDVTFNS